MEGWVVRYDSYDESRLNYRETMLALGNTWMGLRGVEDEIPRGAHNGLYIAGVYDKSECLVSEIVNFAEFVMLRIEVDGETVSPQTCTVDEYMRELDMAEGSVRRLMRCTTPSGKKLRIESTRFLSWYDVRCGAVCTRVTPLNFSGRIRVHTQFDATPLSREGSYFYDESVKHYHLEQIADQFEETFHARARIRDSNLLVDFASLLTCEKSRCADRGRRITGERIAEWIDIDAARDASVTVYKYFGFADSRTTPPGALRDESAARVARMAGNGFALELRRSRDVLSSIWDRMNVTIEGDPESDLGLRFSVYQLMILGSELSPLNGIGSKGLSTEHYGGHYFWCNEIYFAPLFLNTRPQVARNLLEFRLHSLERAKRRARDEGFEGALWPWQSTSEGEEGIRNIVHDDGVVERRCILDQYHIVSDVAFGCLRYLKCTGDENYFRRRLTPLVVEGMRFWKSYIYRHNHVDAPHYHLPHTMGPDEYHRHVNDNYYTNYLTKWVFQSFLEYFDAGSEKMRFDVLGINRITPEELNTFRTIAERMYLPPHRDNVIEQYEGYFKLRDMVIEGFDERGLPLFPDSNVGEGMADAERQHALELYTTNTQLIKQADAIMPFVMMAEDFDPAVIEATVNYYADRTLHFSSLSPGNYAQALAYIGKPDRGLELFKMGALMDLRDIKNESRTGPHTACQGAVYQAAVTGFAGLHPCGTCLEIAPSLPSGWKSLECFFMYRGLPLRFRIKPGAVTLTMMSEGTLRARIKGEIREFVNNTGESRVFEIAV